MLRDEAIEALLARLEDAPVATLTIHVDGGLYSVSLTSETARRGESTPILTDALVSLAEKLDV